MYDRSQRTRRQPSEPARRPRRGRRGRRDLNVQALFAVSAAGYGTGDFYSKMRLASEFRLTRAVSRRISAPTALLSPEHEQFFPGQPQTAYDWLERNLQPTR